MYVPTILPALWRNALTGINNPESVIWLSKPLPGAVQRQSCDIQNGEADNNRFILFFRLDDRYRLGRSPSTP